MELEFEPSSNDESVDRKEPLLSARDSEPEGTKLSGQPSESSLQLCMLLGCAAVYAGRTVVPLVAPELAAELGWSPRLVGYVLSFFFWGYAVTQVPGGRLADRLGGARVMVAAQLTGALSLLAFPVAVVVWPPAAVVLRCLLGLVQGPHYPSLSSLVTQLVAPARRPRVLSLSLLGSPLGTVLLGLLGSGLLQAAGWRAVVALTGLAYAGCALWLHRLTGRCPAPCRRPGAPSAPVPWVALIGSRPVWACTLAHITHAATWFILISWVPTYFKQTRPEAKPWLANTLPFLCNACGTALSAPLADWLSRRQLSLGAVRRTVEAGSQLAVAAALFALPWAVSASASVCLVSAAAFSTALHAGGGLLVPMDLCPEHVGSVFGLMNTGGALAGFAVNLAAGFLVEQYGNFTAVFQMAAALAVAGAAIFGCIGSAERLQLGEAA